MQAGPPLDPMQQAPSNSMEFFSDVAIPLLVIAGGLLIRTLSDGKLQRSDPKTSVVSNITTFADVPDHQGQDEAKEELGLVVDFLKNPEVFLKLGANIPRTVVLTGPGDKDLMAKALAGESGVPFVEIIKPDAPVHDIFSEAEEKAPCIVFIPLDKPCDDVNCDLPDKTAKLPEWSCSRLDEVLNELDTFKKSGIIFVASVNEEDLLKRVSARFDLGVAVGRESDLIVGRRLLEANRLAEAVEAFTNACKGGKWRCGCSFCIAFNATDEMKAALGNAQDLLNQHYEKYHDMSVAIPSVVLPERSLRIRQSVACSACSMTGDEGPGGAVWTAGAALATYITKNAPPGRNPQSNGTVTLAPWRGVNVLELGSGTGIAGIAAAVEGANVLLTDKDDLKPLMAENIRLNRDQIEIGLADYEAFDWAAPPPNEVSKGSWDVVLGAELASSSTDVPLFVDTIASLLGPDGAAAGATAIYAHNPFDAQSPDLDLELQSAFEARGLSWMNLPSLSSATGEAALEKVVFWALQNSSTASHINHASRVEGSLEAA